MPDEEIDKLIRDAASQHHPPYDDTAWGKMEVLLDKHLPQEKDRRRPLFFLLPLLLLGGIIFFIVATKRENKTAAPVAVSTNTSAEKNTSGTATNPVTSSTTGQNTTGLATANNTIGSTVTPAGETLNQTAVTTFNNAGRTKITVRHNPGGTEVNAADNNESYFDKKNNRYGNKGRTNIKIKKPGTGVDDNANTNPANDTGTTDDNAAAPQKEKTGTTDNMPANTTATASTDTVTVAKKDSINKGTETEKEKTTADKKTTTATSKKEKENKKTIADKLGITLSGGADLSFININNAGKLKPIYGAGLSYAAGKHLVINAGLYISKKIYSAPPEDYKFAGGTVYPYLQKINGSCNVYEIPLSVYYNFKQVKKHNWLAGAGLSSFLMKSESYDYIYQYPGGQSYSYNYSVNNENKHYFSVLTLSGGYRYTLNKQLAFIAEPYIKLPLGGVGAGKVKLNSTGLLFTALIKPFAKGK